jgi:hypothetical protein
MTVMITMTRTTTPNRTTSASRRSENPTKTNQREGSCNSSPALIRNDTSQVRLIWFRQKVNIESSGASQHQGAYFVVIARSRGSYR